MKIENGKLYSFKIKDRKQIEQGIVIAEGEEWILVKYIFSDYILDGYMLFNKQYVQSINRDKEVIFIENVLKANNKIEDYLNIEIPLSTDQLFEWLEDTHTIFQIENKDESSCWIGKILDSTEKSIFIIPLTPKAVLDSSKYYTFRKANIRLLSFNTDYINSLLNYNKIL